MERLTDKIGNTNCVKGCGSNCKYGFQYCCKEDWENCQTISDVIDKLAYYEDLEEQGRLLKLPCKVGDTLYRVNKVAKEPVIMMRVLQLCIKQLHKDRTAIKIITINDDDMGENCYFLEDIGKTVFLTKAEAEAKLKELRCGE